MKELKRQLVELHLDEEQRFVTEVQLRSGERELADDLPVAGLGEVQVLYSLTSYLPCANMREAGAAVVVEVVGDVVESRAFAFLPVELVKLADTVEEMLGSVRPFWILLGLHYVGLPCAIGVGPGSGTRRFMAAPL